MIHVYEGIPDLKHRIREEIGGFQWAGEREKMGSYSSMGITFLLLKMSKF
jgi:hypothetical protein